MKIVKSFALLLGVLSLTSCATVINGTRQSVGIMSNPTNAFVWVDQCYQGVTPIIVEMSRKESHVVRIELEGYQPYEATFSKRVSGWAFGNIIFGMGGIIGLAIDAVSGGIYALTPEQIQGELRENQMAYSKTSNESFITIVMEPNPDWKKIGNLVAVN